MLRGFSKRKLSKTLQAFYATPWLLHPDKLAQVLDVLESRSDRRDVEFKIQQIQEEAPEPTGVAVVDGVAVIGVEGIISKRMNLITQFSGGTSTEMLSAQIQSAGNDDEIKGIVLDIDSPGGSANGMTEVGLAVSAARKKKRVVSVVNEFAASGAFWIASMADEIVSLPTGSAGSIGAFTVHRPQADEGSTVIVSPKGSLKASHMLPLTEEAEANLQEQVDDVFDLFASDVATNRGMTRERIVGLEAKTFLGAKAMTAGLVDRIGTLEQVIDELAGVSVSSSVPASAVHAYIPG